MLARNWLIFAAINGFLGVLAGALGAHALARILDPQALGWIATAERYQMWHALALGLAVALGVRESGADRPAPFHLRLAAWLFAAGIVLFCYSLYAMALTGWRGLAVVTPVGGLSLLAGWVALAAYGLTGRRR
ncbi:MAG: DUF423 domain-containing protein [Alphaproteobacteria bacterium]|nr:DUF423 domain-containing protein [Alphaproteobacteria bacterium]